jgi:ribulose-phosphate 3-epimerase
VRAGCQRLIVHAEACTHLHRTLANIASLGATAGVALNPATPAVVVAHVLDLVDQVLVMTVNPGFGGQRYIATMEPKITEVVEMIRAAGRADEVDVEVDGGIGADTVARRWPPVQCPRRRKRQRPLVSSTPSATCAEPTAHA